MAFGILTDGLTAELSCDIWRGPALPEHTEYFVVEILHSPLCTIPISTPLLHPEGRNYEENLTYELMLDLQGHTFVVECPIQYRRQPEI